MKGLGDTLRVLTQTGAPGTDASVTATEINGTVSLNFTVPRGEDGVDATSPLIKTNGTELIISAEKITYT